MKIYDDKGHAVGLVTEVVFNFKTNRRNNIPAEWESAFERIADILDAWAESNLRGGWSTHQVEEQRGLAARIRRALSTNNAGAI